MGKRKFAHRYIAFRPADEVAVSLLFMFTGFAAYALGGIMATLVYLYDRPAAADPRPRHRDPFDRVLVAQARIEGLTLVTADSTFAQHDVRLIRV